MEKEPLISVIIPVYNGERYIENCVKGLINQTYHNIEMIFVNDGSIDKSQEIIERYRGIDSRIISLWQLNKGVSAARNYGINSAQGEYIAFVDADDFVAADYIEYLYDLIKRKKADIALVPLPKTFCGSVPVIEKDTKYDKTEFVWSGEKAARELLLYHIKMSCWCKLFSKKILEDIHILFDESLFCGEGFNFNLECFFAADKVAIGFKTIYFYRVDNFDSAMTKFNIEIIRNGLKAIRCIEQKTMNSYPEMQSAVYYTKWHTYCDFYNMMVGCSEVRNYYEEYLDIKHGCRIYAKYALRKGISFKDQSKGIIYGIAPYLAARMINLLRPRKFKK